MSWHALGDGGWLANFPGGSPEEKLWAAIDLARRIRETGVPGVRDVVNGYDTVLACCDPPDHASVGAALRKLSEATAHPSPPVGRLVEIPVTYGGEAGPDLAWVAQATGLSPDRIVELHTGAEFRVATVGFSPGFPYLAGLPEALRLPRRASPRKVPAGSVAIAGGQAGIYPVASPAGWHVIGRTDLRLFDPSLADPCTLHPGDRVRFIPQLETPGQLTRPETPALAADPVIEVLEPGSRTTVQDAGRPGWRHLGVAPGGAVDPTALAVANHLTGNPASAAALECCLSGPRLRFLRPVRAAWVGWTHGGRPVDFRPGDELDLRRGLGGVTGCLAVAGGIVVPAVMGSASTDVRGGFGGHQGRPLIAGDRLTAGPAPAKAPAPGPWQVRWPGYPPRGSVIEIRCLPGMQAHRFPASTRRAFHHSLFKLGPDSDRMALRLDGPRLTGPEGFEMVSHPVMAGAVQVPPDGRPVLLMPESQTLGGYPLIAHVIAADLPLLARAWPGTRIRFREVDESTAIEAWWSLHHDLSLLRTGLDYLPESCRG